MRDLHKALCGFRAAKLSHPDRGFCATGNWGCGAFGGSPAVKLFVQWVAASLAGLEGLEYYPWDDAVLFGLLGLCIRNHCRRSLHRADAGNLPLGFDQSGS